jgi:heme/copper-type cytochrome/quinol oxidase subunit 3
MPKKITATNFLILSAVAAFFVGVLVYFGVRKVDAALIATGVTFIVSLVGIATLALMVPEQKNDPDKPVLR